MTKTVSSNESGQVNDRLSRWLVRGLLAIHACLLAWSAMVHSSNANETSHLAAGISHWHFGRFDLYKVNPPLFRMVAALPVMAVGTETNWDHWSASPYARSEFTVGPDWVKANGRRSVWLLTLARLACIPFSLLGAYVCYLWGRDLYGEQAGWLSCALWCFSPNILGHASCITPDAHASAVGITADYLFWKWLVGPTWGRAVGAGAMLGLALLMKITFVLWLPLWPMIAIVYCLVRRCFKSRNRVGTQDSRPEQEIESSPLQRTPSDALAKAKYEAKGEEVSFPERVAEAAVQQKVDIPLKAFLSQLVVLLLVALHVLNTGYGYDGTFKTLRSYTFISKTLRGDTEDYSGNRFASSWLGYVPVPLPADFVSGADVQKQDHERHPPMYLRGEMLDHGLWYFYLYAAAIKIPLGTWLLMGLATLAFVWHPKKLPTRWNSLALFIPAIVIFLVASLETDYTAHFRYVLPALPFAFVWAGQAVNLIGQSGKGPEGSRELKVAGSTEEPEGSRPAARKGRDEEPEGLRPAARILWRWLVCGALGWSIGASLYYSPHWLSYCNELVGGPKNGYLHLANSNYDWGQDLMYLEKWKKAHPEVSELGLAYYGMLHPKDIGIEFVDVPGWLSEQSAVTGDEADERAEGVLEEVDSAAKRDALPTDPYNVGPRPGWYAVSANLVVGHPFWTYRADGSRTYFNDRYFTYFQRLTPVDRAGYSILIYHLTEEDLAKLLESSEE